MSEVVTVRKFTYRGDYVTSWAGDVVERTNEHLVLTARWTREVTLVGGLSFNPGDLFREDYYARQPYSVWGVYHPDGATLKGWYCNIGLLSGLDGVTLDLRDLILDVLVLPDGSYHVLDRDEFDAARAHDLPDDLAAIAEEGVGAVLTLLHNRIAPFDVLVAPL